MANAPVRGEFTPATNLSTVAVGVSVDWSSGLPASLFTVPATVDGFFFYAVVLRAPTGMQPASFNLGITSGVSELLGLKAINVSLATQGQMTSPGTLGIPVAVGGDSIYITPNTAS